MTPRVAPSPTDRYGWLTPEALGRVRAALVALTLFVALAVYVFKGLGPMAARPEWFVQRLRGVGLLTWLYAIVQVVDLRFTNSRFARRRRAQMGIPDSIHGLLFGQMVAWYGIVYYALVGDLRPFIAGTAVLLVAFRIFPVRRGGDL